jgi:hypothetical protein
MLKKHQLEKESSEKKNQMKQKVYHCFCGKNYKTKKYFIMHQKIKHLINKNPLNKKDKILEETKIDDINALKFEFQKLAKMLSYFENQKLLNITSFTFPNNLFKVNSFSDMIKKEFENFQKEFMLKKDFDQVLNQFLKKKKEFNCFQIFALFLFYILPVINQKIFDNILYILVIFSLFLNEQGYSLLNQFNPDYMLKKSETNIFENEKHSKNKKISDSNSEMDNTKRYCEKENGEFIPFYINNFLLDFFQKTIIEKYLLNRDIDLNIFGVEPLQMMKLILFFKLFSQWIYLCSFTTKKIVFKNYS